MSDRSTAEQLEISDRNPSFNDLIAKENARGNYGNDAYRSIVESANRTRVSVDEKYLGQ